MVNQELLEQTHYHSQASRQDLVGPGTTSGGNKKNGDEDALSSMIAQQGKEDEVEVVTAGIERCSKSTWSVEGAWIFPKYVTIKMQSGAEHVYVCFAMGDRGSSGQRVIYLRDHSSPGVLVPAESAVPSKIDVKYYFDSTGMLHSASSPHSEEGSLEHRNLVELSEFSSLYGSDLHDAERCVFGCSSFTYRDSQQSVTGTFPLFILPHRRGMSLFHILNLPSNLPLPPLRTMFKFALWCAWTKFKGWVGMSSSGCKSTNPDLTDDAKNYLLGEIVRIADNLHNHNICAYDAHVKGPLQIDTPRPRTDTRR